jgi:DNA polymerase III alpha subunit (gram-positive type)
MTAGASAVTGITDKDLLNCRTRQEVLSAFVQWVRELDSSVLMLAYNGINFDFPLLIVELKRSNLDRQFGERVSMFADPLKWAQVYWPKRYTLSSFRMGVLYEKLFEEELQNAHSALADTKAMVRICRHVTFSAFITSLKSGTIVQNYVRTKNTMFSLCLKKHRKNRPNRSIAMYLVSVIPKQKKRKRSTGGEGQQ